MKIEQTKKCENSLLNQELIHQSLSEESEQLSTKSEICCQSLLSISSSGRQLPSGHHNLHRNRCCY